MADDDEAARKERAAALRQRIASLKPHPKPVEISEDDSEADSRDAADNRDAVDREAPSDESPREFVQRRMRELNNK